MVEGSMALQSMNALSSSDASSASSVIMLDEYS